MNELLKNGPKMTATNLSVTDKLNKLNYTLEKTKFHTYKYVKVDIMKQYWFCSREIIHDEEQNHYPELENPTSDTIWRTELLQ